MNYRASQNGKEKRREQAARYRCKCKQRTVNALSQQSNTQNSQSDATAVPREGYHKDESQEKSCCDRPGCYRRFTPPPRSPLQKFCCSSCRNALRAVLTRERRWLQWLALGLARTRDGPL